MAKKLAKLDCDIHLVTCLMQKTPKKLMTYDSFKKYTVMLEEKAHSYNTLTCIA